MTSAIATRADYAGPLSETTKTAHQQRVEETPASPVKTPREEALDLLFVRIAMKIEEGIRVNDAVDEVLIESTEDLALLPNFRKKTLLTSLDSYLKENSNYMEHKKAISQALMILYSTGLRNSSYGKIVETLEAQMPNLLILKDKGDELVAEAQEFLHAAPWADELSVIQQQQAQAGALIGKINPYLHLFGYLDCDQEERITNIYTHSKFYSAPVFPRCKASFPKLCQTLAINRHIEGQLNCLRNMLVAKTQELAARAKFLHPTTKVALPLEREYLLKNDILLWNCGASLLEKGFRAIFEERRQNRLPLPQDFAWTIIHTQADPEFTELTLGYLQKTDTPALPERYLSEIWDKYLKETPKADDIGGLIRHIVTQLPEEEFANLNCAIKTAEDKQGSALEIIENFLTKECGGKLNLITLKDWILRTA